MSVRTLQAGTAGLPPRIEVRNPAGSVTLEAVEGSDALDVRVEALDAAAEQLLDRVEIDVCTPTPSCRLPRHPPDRRARTPAVEHPGVRRPDPHTGRCRGARRGRLG